MTTIDLTAPARPDNSTRTLLERIRWAGAPIAFAVGPALTSAGFALHPKGQENDQAFVATVNAHPAQWGLGHLLIGLGLTLIAAGVGSALRLARGKRGLLLVAGTAATFLGTIGMGYDAITHGAVGYALASSPQVPLAMSTHVQVHLLTLPFVRWAGLLAVLFPLGAILLGIGVLASRRVPIWGGILLLLGPVGISVAGAGPLELLGAAPLVIGFATVAHAAWRARSLT